MICCDKCKEKVEKSIAYTNGSTVYVGHDHVFPVSREVDIPNGFDFCDACRGDLRGTLNETLKKFLSN